MKSMKKLWIEARSYYQPIWQRSPPADLLAQCYYVKEKNSSRLGCVADGLWVKNNSWWASATKFYSFISTQKDISYAALQSPGGWS